MAATQEMIIDQAEAACCHEQDDEETSVEESTPCSNDGGVSSYRNDNDDYVEKKTDGDELDKVEVSDRHLGFKSYTNCSIEM